MNKNKIRAEIKDKLDKIAALCEKVSDDFDKDIIHDFRVNVKILRSFLRLLRLHTNQKGLKLSHKFKRIYHISGMLRDTQLEYEKISDSKVILPEYLNKLRYMVSTQKKEWKKHYNKKILKKMEDKLLSFEYEKMHPAVLENFFSTKLNTVDKISKSKSPTDDQVHRIRKEVKDVLYTAKLVKKKWKGAQKHVKLFPIKQLTGISDTIGNYNDQRVTLEHISSFSSLTIGTEETNTIKEICNKEKLRLGKEKKNIILMVKELFLTFKK